ncbi:GNAT family N-acetyltransferase [Aquipseudomonas alcaligenes]|uniref:GNAT family N-acetyltransferase n=1 Tax=Aquipseudomonas alcaligenes TaxID=43263 RepID=UPI003747F2CA
MPLTIRPEQPDDATAIEALTIAAFREAPHSSHTEQFIVRELRAAGALSLSLVAEDNGAILGHIALSPVVISSGATGWFGLGPISVAPSHQGQGIGAQLMHAALDALRKQGAAGCVLLGDPAYYARFGFKAETSLVLPEVPAEYFQALSFDQPLPQGIVTYHPAFAAQS